ncbi:MAG: 4Fe-4S dicluster domain-containing protein [Candidatus Freyarchaeota archaeon]|nr:4Fe-4S dicluster domain-containing protein [Candidatus Freyarchaeota archaeon]
MPERAIVKWLKERCPEPQECRLCLKVCPSTVFVMYATERERFRETKSWVIEPSFQNFCVACNKCVEICPNEAIKIEIKQIA